MTQPALNATLNATAAMLLIAGFICIRQRRPRWHARFMLGAFFVSVLFLISYSIYHGGHGHQSFAGKGWIRPVYFSILATHSLLAALVAPTAIYVLYLARGRRFRRHRRWARRLLLPWIYVSATGVLIYFMVYDWFAAT